MGTTAAGQVKVKRLASLRGLFAEATTKLFAPQYWSPGTETEFEETTDGNSFMGRLLWLLPEGPNTGSGGTAAMREQGAGVSKCAGVRGILSSGVKSAAEADAMVRSETRSPPRWGSKPTRPEI